MIRELKEKKIPNKTLGKMFNLIPREMQVLKIIKLFLSTGLAEVFFFFFNWCVQWWQVCGEKDILLVIVGL